MRPADAASAPGAAQAGFSLIEMLVALALLALAIAMLPGVLRLGSRLGSAAEELDMSANVVLALAALEQRIAAASPVHERDAEGRVRQTFVGDSSRLSFVSVSENGPSGAGLYRYRIEPITASGEGLVLRTALYAPSPQADQPPDPGEARVLAPAPATLRFRYFGSHAAAEQAQWHAAWQRSDALPSLVELWLEAPSVGLQAPRRLLVVPRLALKP